LCGAGRRREKARKSPNPAASALTIERA
jgi:hypothetical protein